MRILTVLALAGLLPVLSHAGIADFFLLTPGTMSIDNNIVLPGDWGAGDTITVKKSEVLGSGTALGDGNLIGLADIVTASPNTIVGGVATDGGAVGGNLTITRPGGPITNPALDPLGRVANLNTALSEYTAWNAALNSLLNIPVTETSITGGSSSVTVDLNLGNGSGGDTHLIRWAEVDAGSSFTLNINADAGDTAFIRFDDFTVGQTPEFFVNGISASNVLYYFPDSTAATPPNLFNNPVLQGTLFTAPSVPCSITNNITITGQVICGDSITINNNVSSIIAASFFGPGGGGAGGVNSIPEPGTWLLVGLGLVTIGLIRRRRPRPVITDSEHTTE